MPPNVLLEVLIHRLAYLNGEGLYTVVVLHIECIGNIRISAGVMLQPMSLSD